MSVRDQTSQFESAVLEHLDAAHNLARWLLKNQQDAEDVVQESCMKALRAFDSYRGGDFRAWFLTIVRNTSFSLLRQAKNSPIDVADQGPDGGAEIASNAETFDPQAIAIRSADAQLVRRAIDTLPVVLREAVVLREMEGMSYKEIGKIAGVPIGTVMSRLARGRSQLQARLMEMDKSGQERTR